MIQYVADNIQLFGRADEEIKKLLYDKGQLFCPQSVDYKFSEAHDGQPFLSFDEDGRCSSIPQAGTLVFIRFPDGKRECFGSKKPLIQKEIAEAVCVCGICRDRKSRDPESTPGKRSLIHASWIGISNNQYNQDLPDTLAKRIETWFYYGSQRFEPAEANLKKFMLKGIKERMTDIHSA